MPHAVAKSGEKPSSEKDNVEGVWYLGYGSNMSTKVLSGRRKVYPTKAVPVTVPGYRLTFNMAGLPYWEPGFGTVEPVAEGVVGGDKSDSGGQGLVVSKAAPLLPNTGPVLHCVAFLITHEELEHIIRTEGGGGNADMGYQQLKVRCVAYDGTSLLGVTLIDIEPSTVNLHPSLRYMGLLIEGAIEHGIAPDYVKMLQSVKPYVAKTAGQKVAKYLMVCLFLPLMLPMLAFGFAAVVFGSDIPRVIAAYNERVKSLMWYTHRWVLAPVFGTGC